MIVLLRSALPLIVIIAFVMILTLSVIIIAHSRKALPNFLKLTYHPGYWLLHEVKGRQIKYERATIGFDGGLFMLLTLSGNSPRKNLVIFSDQITTAQYRLIKFIASKVP